MENNMFIANGLLPNKETLVASVVDKERWSQAEARTADLLKNLLPNQTSEQRRFSVVHYLQCLFKKFLPCEVFPFGSVPLKTYLPDGDIDLTIFGENKKMLEDHLMIHVIRNVLENEQQNQTNVEFPVKDVRYIQAEVKIIKCQVENFSIDISFNQLGGLSTLCFFEEVDSLIGQSHLFKLSLILIKAWCNYESHILGSQHGLLSTYALEILVLYIFQVYKNKFAGPLEVLYRFLDFYSRFDWKNYCISLRGPVPIASLPNMLAVPPRKDCQELWVSEAFLNACKFWYGEMSRSQESREQPFVTKFLNIVDPLRENNNLGRRINKGNLSRIKRAFAKGAEHLARFVECTEENLMVEFDLFFKETLTRHGKGYWTDASKQNLSMTNKSVTNSTSHESEAEQAQSSSHGSSSIQQNPDNNLNEPKQNVITCDVPCASQSSNSNTNGRNATVDKGKAPVHSSGEVHNLNFSGPYMVPFVGNLQPWMKMNSYHAHFPPPLPPLLPNQFGVLHENVPYMGHMIPPHPSHDPFSFFPPPQWFPPLLNHEEINAQFNYNMALTHLEHERQMAANSIAFNAYSQGLLPFPIHNFPIDIGTSFAPQQLDSADTLRGEFLRYWLNLQHGMLSQMSRRMHHEPLICPPPPPNAPFQPSPMNLEGHQFALNNGNNEVMGHVHHGPPHSVPVMPSENAALLYGGVYQSVPFWLPRFSGGTGTYLPKTQSYFQKKYFSKEDVRPKKWNHQKERKDNHGGRREERRNMNQVNHGQGEGRRNFNQVNHGQREVHRNLHRKPKPFFFNQALKTEPGTSGTSHEGEAVIKMANVGTDSNSYPNQPSSSNPGVPEN